MTEGILLIVAPIVTGFATWVFTRRKMAADVTGSELDNSAKICEMWKNLSEGMERRFKDEIDELKRQNCDLENQVKAVVQENIGLRNRMHELEEENIKLIRQIQILTPNNN